MRTTRPVPVAAIALGAALVHLVLALLALEPAPYAGGDNATYVALARSLLERGDYTETWDPALRPATLYPPVFPSILAAAIALGASTWVALKTLLAVLSAATVGVSVLWLARVGNRWIAAAAGLVLAAMPGLLAQTHLVLSEIPFTGFALLALWAFAVFEARRREDADARATGWLVVAAIATALAWLTRSAGIALALALLLRLGLSRRAREALLFGAIALIPVAAWWLRGRVLAPHGYSRYLMLADPYRPERGTIGVLELVPRAFENAGTYLLDLGPRFLAAGAGLGTAIALVLLVVALARWAWRLVRERGVPELFVLLYGGLVLIWPQTWAGERFVLPLAPLLLFYAADAVRAAARRWPLRGALPWAAAALALAMVVPGANRQVQRGIACRAAAESGQAFPCAPAIWRDLFEVAAATRGRLEPDAVVISRKPTLFHDLSGHRSAVYPWSADPEVFFALVDSVGADYVVLDRSPDTAEEYLVPVLEARSADFCVLPELSRPMAVLLRIDPAGARAVSQAGAAEGQVRFRTCEAEG